MGGHHCTSTLRDMTGMGARVCLIDSSVRSRFNYDGTVCTLVVHVITSWRGSARLMGRGLGW